MASRQLVQKDQSLVHPPLTIQDVDSLQWDDTADVLVIGYGGAGACAALEAKEHGADVLVVDRFDGGGATAYSGGVIYAGATRFQKEAGFDDSVDAMYRYLSMEVGDVVGPDTLKDYCETSAATLEWLIGHGVPYASDPYLEKTIYPPEGKFLYYSGNEKDPAYAAKVDPAPRGHRPVGTGFTGRVYFTALASAAERMGVRVRRHQKATRLIIDASGRVVGVEVQEIPAQHQALHRRLYQKVVPMLPFKSEASERAISDARNLEDKVSTPRLLRAKKGVILATGGFVFNLGMLRKHQPFFARHYRSLMRLGSMGCDGSGIALGQSAGGAVDRMDSLYAARNVSPPAALLDGILVNRAGERFISEEAYSGYIGSAIANQPDGAAWMILPAEAFRRAVSESALSGWQVFKYYGFSTLLNFLLGGTRRARSLEDLAIACKIDADGLRKTVSAYNNAIKDGENDPLGKSSGHRVPFSGSPLYAVNMSLANSYSFTFAFTLGGLVVDEKSGTVKRPDGSMIEGLHAAGRAAVGLCSNGYLSGMSIGDGVYSGRRAARACLETQEEPARHCSPTAAE